jgi:hypothetical protein
MERKKSKNELNVTNHLHARAIAGDKYHDRFDAG